jgi:hypothetical protein
MIIPENVRIVLKKATIDLLEDGRGWQTETVAGVGAVFNKDCKDWNLSILLFKPGIPPQLREYMERLPIPAVTTVTGRFKFLAGSGDLIESQCVGGHGTLTALVCDGNGAQFLLSCNHVLGGITCEIENGYNQLVATTTSLIPFDTQPIPADAGIAALTAPVLVPAGFQQFPQLNSNQPVDLNHGDNVCHTGAASVGTGTIEEVHVTLRINMNGVFRTFGDVALVDADFAVRGDSGSLVVNTDVQQPTGIVFAIGKFEGRPTKVAICSIGAALDQLGVTIL